MLTQAGSGVHLQFDECIIFLEPGQDIDFIHVWPDGDTDKFRIGPALRYGCRIAFSTLISVSSSLKGVLIPSFTSNDTTSN